MKRSFTPDGVVLNGVFWRKHGRAFPNFEPLKKLLNTTKITISPKTHFFKITKKVIKTTKIINLQKTVIFKVS